MLGAAVVSLLTIGGSGGAPSGTAAPPPPGRFDHGAAGTARNGVGGEIAASPTSASWPGTAPGRNGGPFAFVGAHYGSLWGIPSGPNNSAGVGYCVMEDLAGERRVTRQPDPPVWDGGEMARAAAVMASFGGDRVVPYAIDASGPYDGASGEWQHPSLLGGGEYTRRRHVAVNFAVKMFVEDVSPAGVAAGRKLARDTAVVGGAGDDFPALREGYRVAQHLARVADVQHAVGGITLRITWGTPGGALPSSPGTYPLTVAVTDSTGKPVGFVPVLQLSAIGIGTDRSVAARATVATRTKSRDDRARWAAAAATGWPTLEMGSRLADDPRFALRHHPDSADVTDATGLARFDVTIDGPAWELAFHAQAPTANVDLYAGSGIQGQITWSGRPQSASIHQRTDGPGRLSIRKVLDATDVQGGRDMSGFVFTVDAASSPDTALDTAPVARLVTGADGRTRSVELPVGEYRVTEVDRPSWATILGDGGPIVVAVGAADAAPGPALGATSPPVEVVYTNTVPVPSISTRAVDAADGDKHVGPLPTPDPAGPSTAADTTTGTATDTAAAGSGATTTDRMTGTTADTAARSDDAVPGTGGLAVSDEISYRGLVPGTPYVARGALLVDACDGWCESPVAVAEVPFGPTTPDGVVVARFDLPPDAGPEGATGVVVQAVVVAASGRVVATHHDRTDPDQTGWFALPPTTTSPSTTTTTSTTTSTTTPTETAESTAPTSTTTSTTTSMAATATTAATTTSIAASTTSTTSSTSSTTTVASAVVPTASRPSTSSDVPARTIARTGNDGSSTTLAAGIALVMTGTGILLVVRRPRHEPRS
jgi:hypothetical protein